MFFDTILQKESNKFKRGIERNAKRRKEWDMFIAKAKPFFESLCSKAKSYDLFENLYVIDNKTNTISKNTLPFITLMWGQHPTGYTKIDDSRKWGVEKGCALHFSQNIFGYVACILYPFYSDFHEPNEKYYIYKMFKKPSDINKKELKKAVELMFLYAQTSSMVGYPDFYDHFRITMFKIVSIAKKINYSQLIKPTLGIIKEIVKHAL